MITTNPINSIVFTDKFQIFYYKFYLYNFHHQGKWYSFLAEALNKIPIKIGKSLKDLDISNGLKLSSIFDSFNLFIFHVTPLQKHNVAKESYFIIMKSTFP